VASARVDPHCAGLRASKGLAARNFKKRRRSAAFSITHPQSIPHPRRAVNKDCAEQEQRQQHNDARVHDKEMEAILSEV